MGCALSKSQAGSARGEHASPATSSDADDRSVSGKYGTISDSGGGDAGAPQRMHVHANGHAGHFASRGLLLNETKGVDDGEGDNHHRNGGGVAGARDATRKHNNFKAGQERVRGAAGAGTPHETDAEQALRAKTREETDAEHALRAKSREAGARLSFSNPNVYGSQWPAWLEEFAGEALIGWKPRLIMSYQKISKVGQGTYSTVYKAMDLHRNCLVALKKIRLESMDSASLEFMSREIVILRKLNHPNVIKLLAIASSREKGTMYLVFEYVEHDLAGLLSATEKTANGGFRLGQVKNLMMQLFGALEHCHARGVCPLDPSASPAITNPRP
jgi:hypothetical protein